MNIKTFNLISGREEGAHYAIQCRINSNEIFENKSYILLTTKEQYKKHQKNTPGYKRALRNEPSHKRHTKKHNHRRQRNFGYVELFSPQPGCDMHHINRAFVLPCLSFVHEQPHICGDLLLEGWA